MQQIDLFALTPPTTPAPERVAWTAPTVDMGALARAEAEGRSIFGAELHDPDAAQGAAYETMIGLTCDMAEIRGMDRLHRLGRSGFRNDRAWRAFQADRPAERAAMFATVLGTIALIAEVWGRDGAAAFAKEARRRSSTCR